MEVSYGIGTTNRYALFYDENDDPMEALKKAQETAPTKETKEKSKQAEAKPKGKPSAAPVKKDVKESNVSAKPAEQTRPREEGQKSLTQRPPQTRGDRGGRFPANGNREERNNRRNEDRPRDFSAPMGEGVVAPGEGEYRGRGGARGGPRGGRARGRGRPQDNRGKREYERQSGSDKSGVKPIEKREGAGSHNWGSVKDEIEGQLEVATEGTWAKEGEPLENATAEGAEAKEATEEGAAEAEAAAAAAAEEEAKELTLDEWKARNGERKKPEFNIRKPGEGEDDAQWKKTFLVEKKKNEDEDEEEEDYGEYLQRAGRQKYLDIDIRFADSRRGGPGGPPRGGRGGRGAGGRGRGGAGRGGPRPSQPRGGSQQYAPKVDDENDFPALG